MPSTVDVQFIVFENTSSQVKKDSILYRYPDFDDENICHSFLFLAEVK